MFAGRTISANQRLTSTESHEETPMRSNLFAPENQ
ncbi:MAG: hypothetical protein K0S40_4347, partial [Actinomycetospora sp.]|nr:hypothetical protein [Actinomycetospora sp.]